MCQKLFLNMILVMEWRKYEVGRNFWFWQKFLSFSLSTEHFAEKSRKMLKNSFFQIWRQSIVFAYFRKKLILKGVFCSKAWISRTQIQITFVKKILSWFLGNPPQIWWKKFPCSKQQCCFFDVPDVCAYHFLISKSQRTSHNAVYSIR